MASPDRFAEHVAYLEKRPAVYDEVCRQVPDLFIARAFGIIPCRMHIELQRYLDTAGETATVGMPRNHGKTTQVTIGRVAWEIGHNPNLRVQIVQATGKDSKKTVGAIKEIIESEVFQRVFPEIKKDPDNWGTESFTVKRTKLGIRDSTCTAQPIFGKAGQRSDLMLFDDIENFDNSIRKVAEREQVKEAYRETWLPVLEPGGREWRVGTPWSIEGITVEWIEGARGDGRLFWRVCDGVEQSPWPEKFSPEYLARRRTKMGEIAYARAFNLKALSGDEVVFQEDDLKGGFCPLPKEDRLRGRRRIAAIDLAYSDDDQALKRGKHSPDYAVMGVADLDDRGHVYMVRVLRMKCSYPNFKTAAVAEARRLEVERVLIESNGPQKGLRQDLGRAFAEVGISHKGETRSTDKYSRAAAVQAVVEQRRFHHRTDPAGELMADMRPMFDELRTFPTTGKDDCVDVAVDLMAEAAIAAPGRAAERRSDPTLVSDIEKDMEEPEAAGVEAYAQFHEPDRDFEDDD